MQIRLLGGVGATDEDGAPIDIGPAKCQALLAALALSPGSAVPVTRLVDLVWGEDPPRTAEKTLQTYVTQLRQRLGAHSIARVGAAYRLDADPELVDAIRFQRRLDDGDVAAALAEWTGPPLAGLDAPGLDATVAGLVEQWLTAVEADLERLTAEDPAGAVGPLTELTADHPFREGLWALLMTALYASGRQAEALAAYRAARRHLVDELGVEPGPRLRELEASILDQDDRLPSQRRPGRSATLPTGTVTFAFSDVEGSTRLWSADRLRAAAVIARHEEIVRAAVADHSGHVFATGGDSFGVAFHRASDAVDWAAALQAAIAAEPWPPGGDLRLRIGLHTGEAEERADSYFGSAVNLTARVAAAGHGGQTLLSGVTAALVGDRELVDLGPVGLDGVDGDQPVFQLGRAEHPSLRAEGRRRGNLPRSQGPLFGRDDLLADVVDVLASAPVVTLVGPGGIGKTRLALDAARLVAADVPGGVWLVELADVASSGEVARAVADVLDVTALPGRPLTAAVAASLDARRALLVLDNCEHVVDGAAELAAAIADGSEHARVLATSREGLGVGGEQLVVVGPLDPAGAGIELFHERATAVDRLFDLDAHHHDVTEICHRLDGVPLAIELAAARTRTMAPADVLARLDDSFRLLTGGRRQSVERHRTLRATIQWSYDLLTPAEQTLFRRLSVFAGSFDLGAAETVAPDDELLAADVGGLLGDLVERSMVLAESGADGRRFRLLETMRQFGAERLAEAGTSDVLAGRHARFVAGEVERIAALLAGTAEVDGARRLGELWPNLRAAVDWAVDNDDLPLATALVGPVAAQAFARRGIGELAYWFERILSLADPDDDDTIAMGLLWVATYHSMTNDRAAYRAVEERFSPPDHVLAALAHAMGIDDGAALAEATPPAIVELRRRGEHHLATMFDLFSAGSLLGHGELDDAERRLGEFAEQFRREGPPTFLNWTLFMLAAGADFRGDTERAGSLYDEVRRVRVPPFTNSPNEILETRAAFRGGDETEAFELMRRHIDELLAVGNMSAAGLLGIEFVNMMTATGRLVDAAPVLGYLDRSGILDVEGPGFRLLVEDAAATVEADADARSLRRRVSAQQMPDEWVLTIIRDALDRLLDQDSTAAPPPGDRPASSSGA